MRWYLIVVYMLSISALAEAPKALHLVEDPWPPYTYGEYSSKPTRGAVVEVLEYIFRDSHLKLTLYPWKRALLLAKEGIVDGLMLTVETKEREDDFIFSEPIFNDEIVFIVHSEQAIHYQGLHSLKGLIIGTVHGSKYSNEFQEAIQQKVITVEPADEIQTNIKKLMNRRIDVVVSSKIAFCNTFKEIWPEANFTILSPALKKIELKIAISKKSSLAHHIDYINKEIIAFKKEPNYHEIVKRYFGECHVK